MTSNAAALARYDAALMGTYGTPLRPLARGEGSRVWDEDGNEYLDLLGGIAVNALGHAHPAWVEAVSRQAQTLSHTSNFFATAPQIDLAERLLQLAGAPAGSRVFFCNSGTEAVEAAFKIARTTGKQRMIALEGSFHGRSLGALSLTHKPAIREPFEPLVPQVTFVPPTADALAGAMGDDVAAVVVEPLQGEAGVKPLPEGLLAHARRLCDEHGALLILDEIQTGVARTGAWFAHQRAGVTPDVMTLAKGLGGGFPIGAVIAYGDKNATALGKGAHGTTFGGNPLACAAALATLDVIESEGLVDHAKTMGEWLRGELSALDGVTDVRGEGLLLGIALENAVSAQVVATALDAGFIVNAPSPDVVRLAPALTLTQAEAAPFVAWFADTLPTLKEAP